MTKQKNLAAPRGFETLGVSPMTAEAALGQPQNTPALVLVRARYATPQPPNPPLRTEEAVPQRHRTFSSD